MKNKSSKQNIESVVSFILGIVVGAAIISAIEYIYETVTMPKVNECYAHSDLDTYSKVLSIEEGLVYYKYASREERPYGKIGIIPNKSRSIESFKKLYTEQQDCSGYMYNKWILEKEWEKK